MRHQLLAALDDVLLQPFKEDWPTVPLMLRRFISRASLLLSVLSLFVLLLALVWFGSQVASLQPWALIIVGIVVFVVLASRGTILGALAWVAIIGIIIATVVSILNSP